MTRFAAFLRGINLGNRAMGMPELRKVAEDLGFADVATYVRSGNLVLSCDDVAEQVEARLATALGDRFGYSVDVMVRTGPELYAVVQGNPFSEANPSQVTVAFLAGEAPAEAEHRVAALATAAEPWRFAGREIYVLYGDGQARSKLASRFSATVGVSTTVRTIRTAQKVLDLVGH